MPPVAVVTDSTATLPAAVVAARGIRVVPLQVVIGTRSFAEGLQGTPDAVAAALRQFAPISTSRPAPQAFLAAYEALAGEGCTGAVSVHLSGAVSGTFESAEQAAARAALPVWTVDTRQVGMGVGFAVLAASDELRAGGDAAAAAAAATASAAATVSYFYVDTLEHLRRGGRIGAAAALVGSALAVKPLLTVRDGRIGPLEKVRTAARALGRIEELAVEAAKGIDGPVRVAVQHLAAVERAQTLGTRLSERLQLAAVLVSEVGAVIGAHVGPGMVAVVVAPG